MITPAHDFQPRSTKGTKLFNPPEQGSQVATIGPDHLDVAEPTTQLDDLALGVFAILHPCACDRHCQDQSQSFYGQVNSY